MTKITKWVIQGRGKRGGGWDEGYVGGDYESNSFDTREDAEAMIPELVKIFADDDPPPTAEDYRVIEREEEINGNQT